MTIHIPRTGMVLIGALIGLVGIILDVFLHIPGDSLLVYFGGMIVGRFWGEDE